MPVTRTTSSHIVDENQEPNQDYRWELFDFAQGSTKNYSSSRQLASLTYYAGSSIISQHGWGIRGLDWSYRWECFRQSSTTFWFIDDPPYSKEILSKPYPKKYESPTFPQYDGRKGSSVEYVNKFFDALGAHAGDKDLCLSEFSKTLSDRAYTWYTTLLPSFIHSWDEMVEQFCQIYFQSEERNTILDLYNTRQCAGKDLVVYAKRFTNLVLDCYGGHVESFLVEIYINNMFPRYRAILENIKISQCARLLNAARRIAIFVKAISVGSL
ncbi:hypothetical protein SLEP1_g22770 [Rubroshorea leprosula]|uniref:Retrotransposon gag domain-containing protein n=1 Tax=Rubroshorea leprosula TaxID=152421 RepID=A0AAV5JD77_9ROSI|nr:hypothetical protein SLEP1_g22770 [Rubroshorea leprosula]